MADASSAAASTQPVKGFKQGPKLPADADLAKVAIERGIELFLVSFVDLYGVLRSKMVPAAAISFIQKNGAGFAPFASWLDHGPESGDMVAIPDPTTLLQIPFQPELAFVVGDCYIDGAKVEDSPRWVLKQQVAKAEADGYVFKTGVEAEFFLLRADEMAISDPMDRQDKACYDVQAMMRRYSVLSSIVNCLNACDFGVYQADHEDANGQFEINWHYADCLTTADRHVFFKWITKTVAERHGYRATFMPRPFRDLTGSGCHVHCSLWSGEKNVFADGSGAVPSDDDAHRERDVLRYCESSGKWVVDAEAMPAFSPPPREDPPGDAGAVASLGLSQFALHFLGGVLEKTASLCAVTNPSVNSYKRLNGAVTNSGSTWSPNRISFSGNNRTHMVRVPEADRFELRLADGAVNPYLLPAVVLAAGLWGVSRRCDPSACFMHPAINMYQLMDGDTRIAHIRKLPLNLLDALRLLERDAELPAMLNPKFIQSFLKLKNAEWRDYCAHLSQWELDKTLDC